MGTLALNRRVTEEVVADAGQTDFAVDFPLFRDLIGAPHGVYVQVVRGEQTLVLDTTHFTVPSETVGAFTLRLNTGAQANDKVRVFGKLPAERLREHPPGGAVRTPTLEGDAVSAQAQLQEHARDLDRSLLGPFGETGHTLPSREALKGKMLVGDSVTGDLTARTPAPADGAADLNLENVDGGAFSNKAFSVITGGEAINLYDRLGRRFDLFDLGGKADDELNIVPLVWLGLQNLKAKGGGILRIPEGRWAWLADLPAFSVAGEENIRLLGEGRDQTYIRYGGAATRGWRMRSTTTTFSRLPRFEISGLTMAASGEGLGWAFDAEWAINGDIEDPFSMSDVAIQQHLASLADDGTDYGYFKNLVRVKNARNSNIKDFRFIGELDRAGEDDKTADAILLEGECTSFRIENGYVLEAKNFVRVSGETEGLYCLNVDAVGVRCGVDMTDGSVLEPQLTWEGGTIASMAYGIRARNLRYISIDGTFLLAKKGWNAMNPSTNWIGVEVTGALSGYGKIYAAWSKEHGHGDDGATSTAVDIKVGTGYQVGGVVHAYSNTDPIDYGVRLRSGVTACQVDLACINTTVDFDYDSVDGNQCMRRNPSELQLMGGRNQLLTILGTLSAGLKMYDLGAAANNKEGRWVWDDGTLRLLLVNDDGTTKKTPLQVAADGVVTIGDGAWNGMPVRLGAYRLWVDGSGRLRIKNSAPTSDTDGTIVGTQS